MSLNEENLLTKIFNEYVEKSPDGQLKMSEFFNYVERYGNKRSMSIFDTEIKIDNQDIKSIYFDEYFHYYSKLTISNSNDLKIVINEKYKINNFTMNNCNNIDLTFILESNKDGFVHQNNFSFEQCKFKTINIEFPSENKHQFVLNNNLTFENTIFKESVNFDGKIFNANVKFINCTFLKDISFNKAVFEKEVEFQNCVFNNKVDFSNATFKDNAYFNDSKFKGVFMLYRAQFYKVADFFNLEFNDIYNFSSCAFKEPEFVSFIGFKTNINIETLENYIEKTDKEEKTNEEHKSMIVKRTEITWAENLKNSFAVIKHNFLQRDNLIEANKHKVLEFYAEELRLKYVREIKDKDRQDSGFLKATIDYLQLLFYRHTSNHHSDLLKSFNTMLLLIGLFAVFNYLIVSIFNHYYLGVCMFDMQTYSAIINNFIASNKDCLIFINLTIIVVFFLSFIGFLCLKNIMNKAVVIASYICSFLLLAISPKSIISITNLFSGNQHILDPLSALSGIYTILFILLIYSLQKTSRRNSIM